MLHYKLPGPQGNKGYMKGQALEHLGTKKLRCLVKVFQCHKFEPEVEFISSNSSSSNKSDSENIICHDKLLLDCYT